MSIYHFLIVCPLVFLAGFIDSIAGGGGLISLPAYLFSGLPVHNCIATNKLSSSMGTSVSTIKLLRHHSMSKKILAPSILSALIGAVIGAKFSLLIPETYFKIIMLAVLPVSAYVVLNKNILIADTNICPNYNLPTIVCIAFCLGIYDGLYGPGTGTFLIVLFSLISKMNVLEANTMAKVINLSTNISSLIIFLLSNQVAIELGLAAALFSILGNYLGTKCFLKHSLKLTRYTLIIVIFIFFIKIIIEII